MSVINELLQETSKQCLKAHKEVEALRIYFQSHSPKAVNKLWWSIDHLERTLLDMRNISLFVDEIEKTGTDPNTSLLAVSGSMIEKIDYKYEIRLPLFLMDRHSPKVKAGSYIYDTLLRALKVYTDKYGYPSERMKRVVIAIQQAYSSDVKPSGLLDNDNTELRQTINLLKATFLSGDDPINTTLVISAAAGTHNITFIRLIDLDKSEGQSHIMSLFNNT